MFGKKENEIMKISRESAEEQLQEFCSYYDIDEKSLNDEKSKSFANHKEKFVNAIMNGRLEFRRDKNDDIEIVQTVGRAGTEQVVYGSQVGKAFTTMKKYDEKDGPGRVYAVLGSLSGLPADAISQLKPSDLKTAFAIGLTIIDAIL